MNAVKARHRKSRRVEIKQPGATNMNAAFRVIVSAERHLKGRKSHVMAKARAKLLPIKRGWCNKEIRGAGVGTVPVAYRMVSTLARWNTAHRYNLAKGRRNPLP